ncbi:glycosyltransferase family 2 protein [Bacteroides hominis]|uniref:glycosyltransferase family 2 protein n=1 Tax=Bacteroides hominis TaxID=2763023 RepID=UPI003D6BE0BC
MVSPQISVILPVYNAEQYLHRMLKSLQVQTFTDFEVIMVDDGSTDSSGLICDKYATIDNRFRVLHKQNRGVSAARQAGIDNAQGKYVIHADADDWVDPTMLKDLYQKAKETNADIIICDFFTNSDTQKTYYHTQRPPSLVPINVLHALFRQLHGSCWNKLVKRACYSKYNCRFLPDINYCEDLLFWVQLLQHPEIKIDYLNKAYYHYCMNDNSITRAYTRETYNMRCTFLIKIKELLPVKGFEYEKRRTRLNIITEAFMFQVVSNNEARQELMLHNKRTAFCETKSLRWFVGYLALGIGCYNLAKRLLKY